MKKISTHYDTLKIPRSSSSQEIKTSYKKLIQKYHPDRNKEPDAEKITKEIVLAYQVLSNDVRKKEHDEWINYQESLIKKQYQHQYDANTKENTKKEANTKDYKSKFNKEQALKEWTNIYASKKIIKKNGFIRFLEKLIR